MKETSVYFPNLNGIRFIAAFTVIIHHIEQFKYVFELSQIWEESLLIRSLGKLGVILFFTLSGFLITYLLLFEEKNFGKVNIKQFYIRRLLRIWPLYFLIFFLAFFVFSNIGFFNFPGANLKNTSNVTIFVFFTFFLSNFFLAKYGVLPFASQEWSVATEEQFYLIWPWILRFSKNKLLSLIIVVFFVFIVNVFLSSHYSNALSFKATLKHFWDMFNIDCMAIGGIFAYLLFKGSNLLKFVMNKLVFYLSIIFLILLFVFYNHIPVIYSYITYIICSFIFAVIIINFASNKNLGLSLEHKWFNYLGKISYGLYMYHSVAIFVTIKLLLALNIPNSTLIFLISFALSVFIAHISYYYFENLFLKLKYKFSKIKTL